MLSGSSLEEIPPFSIQSNGSNVNLPNKVIWNTMLLSDTDLIIYIDKDGEKHMVSKQEIDENQYYNITIIDDS